MERNRVYIIDYLNMLSGYRTEILILVEMLLFHLLASSYFLLLRVFAGVS